jgi:hypothetical protein
MSLMEDLSFEASMRVGPGSGSPTTAGVDMLLVLYGCGSLEGVGSGECKADE